MNVQNQAYEKLSFRFKEKYGNFINGNFVDPVDGQWFDNITPVTGKVLCKIARSNEKDINVALDAAHAAKDAWGKTIYSLSIVDCSKQYVA